MELKLGDLNTAARSQVKAGIRKAFKYGYGGDYLVKARVELPRKTKTGKVSAIPDVYFKCASCEELKKQKEVQVDHIDPVVPIGTPEKEMSINDFAYRAIKSECQVLCKPCHREKTNEENAERKVLAKRSRV